LSREPSQHGVAASKPPPTNPFKKPFARIGEWLFGGGLIGLIGKFFSGIVGAVTIITSPYAAIVLGVLIISGGLFLGGSLLLSGIQQLKTPLSGSPVVTPAALSDRELAAAAINWATRMRNFEALYEAKSSAVLYDAKYRLPPSKKPDTAARQKKAHALRQEQNLASDAIRSDELLMYQNEYQGRAVYFRDQLLQRLKTPAPPHDRGDDLAFSGILAGPHPISQAANYLERLAMMLSP
jgi:hypothetical protein